MDQTEKFLRKLGKKERRRLLELLDLLARGLLPDHLDLKPLRGLANLYRIRKGNIRIIIYRQGAKIGVVRIDYRKDVY
jgi:mRNA-degrading endonuclease RelE of RelBE toxin-antitoxin system